MTDSTGKPVPPVGAGENTAQPFAQEPQAASQPPVQGRPAADQQPQATSAAAAAAQPQAPADAQPQAFSGAAGQPQTGFAQAQQAQPGFTQPQPQAQQPQAQAAQQTATVQQAAAQQQAAAEKKAAKQAKKQQKAASGKQGGGFGRAFAGGVIGALVVLVVVACLWQFTPALNAFKGGGTASTNTGGTITIDGSDEATTAEAVAAKDLSSVVTIYVYTSTGSSWSQLFGNSSGSTTSPSALGSGVIVKKDDTYSYIVTNYHVVENASRAVVSVGGEQVDAESVGYDSSSDLAVIKIKKTDTTVAEWGDSDNLKVGQWVAAIGTPYGYEQTLTTGIVSALYRSDVLSSSSSGLGGTTVYTDMIQTDASINPGNSGGGLFDDEGKLIGINTYISSTSESSAGLGFAIPQSTAQSEVETLISGQEVTHAFLGILLGDVSSNPTGVTVAAVYKDTAAAQAGLKTGDIVTKIGDKSITSTNDVRTAVASKKVGDEISIVYVRDGKESTGTAKLGDDSSSNSEYAEGGEPATSNSNSGSNNGNNGYGWNYGNSGDGYGNLFDYYFGNGSSGSGNSGTYGNSGQGNSGSSDGSGSGGFWGN